jgi:cystathionine beta-lyase
MSDFDPTALIHHPYQPPAGFVAPQLGVHKASTVIFPTPRRCDARDWRYKDGYTYGLHGTPTTFTLEERIATLEGGTECCWCPAAWRPWPLVDLALLKAGDEVLLPDNVYGPSRELARTDLARWGITHRLYDPLDAAVAGRADRPHEAGLAGGRRIGDDGVPRPAGPGAVPPGTGR